jgi:hypothetical protein
LYLHGTSCLRFSLQVTRVVGNDLLDLLEQSAAGGLLGQGHSWVGPVTPEAHAHAQASPSGPKLCAC